LPIIQKYRRKGAALAMVIKAKTLWVHIRSAGSYQALYIDGIKEIEGEQIDIVEAFDLLAERTNNEAYILDYTYEDIDEEEDPFDNAVDRDFDFPESLDKKDVI